MFLWVTFLVVSQKEKLLDIYWSNINRPYSRLGLKKKNNVGELNT